MTLETALFADAPTRMSALGAAPLFAFGAQQNRLLGRIGLFADIGNVCFLAKGCSDYITIRTRLIELTSARTVDATSEAIAAAL